MMHLLRCLLLAPFVVASLIGCYEELELNESASGQSADPGKLNVVLQVESRRVTEEEDEETEEDGEEQEVTKFTTRLTGRLFYSAAPRGIRLTEQDSFIISTAAQQVSPEVGVDGNRRVFYSHTFDPALTGETMTVSLNRTSPPPVDSWYSKADTSEPDFSNYYVDTDIQMEMPPDVSITSPTVEEGFRAVDESTAITVTWTPFDVWEPDNISKPDNAATELLDESTIDTPQTLFFSTLCQGVSSFVNQGWVEIDGDPGMVDVPLRRFFELHEDADDRLSPLSWPGPVGDDGDSGNGEICTVQINLIRHTNGTFDTDALSDESLVYGRLLSEPITFFVCPESVSPCPPSSEEDDS